MNRAAVVLLGAVVLVGVLAIGGGAFLVLGGGGNGGTAGTPTAVDATPLPLTPTPTAAPTSTLTAAPTSTPTATPTSTPTSTPTAAPRTTVLARRFDERRVEVLVVEEINERRAAEGLEPLEGNGTTAGRLRAMAREHSVAMANAGKVRHRLDGNASTHRYRQNDLYRLCKWEAADHEAIIAPDNNGHYQNKSALEAVGRTYAGQVYSDGQFNGNERAVATAVVEQWWDDYRFHLRLTLPRADTVGVGVEITQTGEVYVTADLCRPR